MLDRFRAVGHQGNIAGWSSSGSGHASADSDGCSMGEASLGRRKRYSRRGKGHLVPVGDENVGVDGSEAAGQVISSRGVVFRSGAGANLAFDGGTKIGICNGKRVADCDAIRRADRAGHGIGAVLHVMKSGWKLRRQGVKYKIRLPLPPIQLVHQRHDAGERRSGS